MKMMCYSVKLHEFTTALRLVPTSLSPLIFTILLIAALLRYTNSLVMYHTDMYFNLFSAGSPCTVSCFSMQYILTSRLHELTFLRCIPNPTNISTIGSIISQQSKVVLWLGAENHLWQIGSGKTSFLSTMKPCEDENKLNYTLSLKTSAYYCSRSPHVICIMQYFVSLDIK